MEWIFKALPMYPCTKNKLAQLRRCVIWLSFGSNAFHLCTLAWRMLIQILFISHWFFLPVPLLHLNQHDVWRSQSRGGQSWSRWSEAAQTRPCCCPTSPERLTRWGPWVRNMIYLWKLNTLEVFKIWATTWRLRRWQRPPPHRRWSLQSPCA